ncbi:hypothetical protein [Blastochloris viridis]|uniref:Uncharacterized protein n=2 Tax=Blastochloris viridis TaxID=1079 RepID=A0A0S4PXV3_BLAVI|nr:hypothetical protein [Blastochloris viridis]CUU41102.1 hypothetical protein BVIRIDIS_00900 [Blastochloris viridis]
MLRALSRRLGRGPAEVDKAPATPPAAAGPGPQRRPEDIFSPEMDFDFCRERHEDLRTFSDQQLKTHYEQYGRREGRLVSLAASRAGLISLVRTIAPALEIGPFDRPILPRETAKFFDVQPSEELRKRAAPLDDRDPDGVPHIDYVSPTGDLSIVDDRFRLVVSSHAIEHQPDLVGHLRHVARILDADGCYALLIPDCRYCFDHFLPPSNVGAVIDAHLEGRRVHRLASVIEHHALTTHNDSLRHWHGDHAQEGRGDVQRIRNAIAEWQAAAGGYIDVHAWQFTPQSFREITATLHALGLTGLRPLRVYETPHGSNEFCAVLVKD